MFELLHLFFIKLKGYKIIGEVRHKNESMAPKEWKENWWEKLKKDKLFHPIDIHNKNHYKEVRIKIGKKFLIVAVNIFLISFSYNIAKDSYNLIKADYKLINKNNIKINLPENIEQKISNKEQLYIHTLWKDFYIKQYKKNYIETYKEEIKSNLFSFINNLFILFLILKKRSSEK